MANVYPISNEDRLTILSRHLDRDGFIPLGGGEYYQARPLAIEDVERAAELVETLSTLPTLTGGVVGFGHGLSGGYWYHDSGEAMRSDRRIIVGVPGWAADRDTCRVLVLHGIEEARKEVDDSWETAELELLALSQAAGITVA